MPSWTPPTAQEQTRAAQLGSVPKSLLPWLRVRAFEPIQKPAEDDWPHGAGQTFDEFMALRVKGPKPGSKIYLLPLGQPHEAVAFPDLGTLAEGTSAFYGLQCEVLPMITLEQLEGKASGQLIRKRGRQINASDVIANLKKWRPADGFAVCAVTMSDLFKGSFNFLYGLAGLHAGVVSFHRFQPNSPSYDYDGPATGRPDEVLLRHTMDVLTHELGHCFGLKHCTYFSCVMQGFNSLEEAEGHAPDFCLVCLRKLLWITNVQSTNQVRAQYERMLAFYEGRPGFEKHAAVVRMRLGVAPPAAKPAAKAGEVICQPCEESAETAPADTEEAPTGHSGSAPVGTVAARSAPGPSYLQPTATSACRDSAAPKVRPRAPATNSKAPASTKSHASKVASTKSSKPAATTKAPPAAAKPPNLLERQ
jgi:archaemetzincin